MNSVIIPAAGGLAVNPPADQLVWNPAGASDLKTSAVSAGEQNQIRIGAGYQTVSDWPGVAGTVTDIKAQIAQFKSFLGGGSGDKCHGLPDPAFHSYLRRNQRGRPMIHSSTIRRKI